MTEEATGVDLVAAQLQIASGASLASLGLTQPSIRLGATAMQARVQMTAPGGALTSYAEPGGAGIRVDSSLYANYTPPTTFDPLLLKVSVCHPDLPTRLSAYPPTLPTLPPSQPSNPPTLPPSNPPTLLFTHCCPL